MMKNSILTALLHDILHLVEIVVFCVVFEFCARVTEFTTVSVRAVSWIKPFPTATYLVTSILGVVVLLEDSSSFKAVVEQGASWPILC